MIIRKISGIFFISVILLQVWFLIVMVIHPYIGADVVARENEWVIYSIDGKSNAGLMVGDVVLEVNGKGVDQFSSVIRWHSLEQADSIVVQRNGVKIVEDVKSMSRITYRDSLSTIGEIFCFIIAIALFRLMKHSKSGRYLSYLFVGIGITFMCLGASIRGDVLGKGLISAGIIGVPILLLHFLVVFFQEKGNIKIKENLLKYAYGIVGIFIAIYLLLFMKSWWAYELYRVLLMFSVILFIIGVSINLVMLFYLFLRYRTGNREISLLVKTVWGALFLSFTPLACLTFIPQIVYKQVWVDSIYSSWAVLFFPLSFTYLLAAKKLFDIDLVVRRFIFTTALSFVPGGIMVGFIVFLFPEQADASRLTVAFMMFVVLLSITLYSFEYFTTKLMRAMFPRKYRLQESLKMIARNLGNISNFHNLKDIILVDIIETLQVFGGAIVLRYPDAEEEIIKEGEFAIPADNPGIDWMEAPAFTRFEINRNEEYACYLILTGKKANTQLGFEETQWLKLIISYLSVSLENLHLIRKLTVKLEQLAAKLPREEESAEIAWFRKLMLELQEKERVRIATDLHDTTMQDLFFLKRRCAALMEESDDRPEAAKQIRGIIDYIDVINMNLRESCFQLHPYLLKEIGLIRTIQKLIDLEAATAPYKIEFHAGNASVFESSTMEFKRHLFRMVQELVNNAKKHAEPSHVRVELSAANSRLYLFYEDDGVGFDADNAISRDVGSSRSGMEYMKSRVLSLNGHYELISSKGRGLRFMAEFPLAEGRSAS